MGEGKTFLRGDAMLVTRRSVSLFAVLLLSLLCSAKSFAQNLESENYYTLEAKVKNQSAALNFQEGINDAFVVAADMAARLVVSLTDWKEKQSQIPQFEPFNRTYHYGRWINDPTDDTCYNTRAKVLDRDSQVPVKTSDGNSCKVAQGLWQDPYTQRAIKDAKEIQIDHVVPLKNSYSSGAFKWDKHTRCLYANFMGNSYHLLSVEGKQNMSKGDRSPADYLPPNKQFRCEYIKTWLKIKMIWALNMSEYEAQGIKEAIAENNCPESMFQMSLRELNQQRDLISSTDYICRN
jgi:hypothetical protein